MSRTEGQTFEPVTSVKGSPRIAIIGCGAIAEMFYLPALVKYPSVLENLILVDRDQKRAQKLATEFRVKNCFVDYRDVLSEGVDGVIIATPSHLHHPIAMDFLIRGVHVLCEKPLAESADKAKEMVQQAQKTGAAILTTYQRRLYASYLKVKELLADGTLGEPLSIKYFEGEEFRWPTASGFYFNTKVSSRGVLLDRGAHVLDLICWWLGTKPKLISSQNDSFGGREAVARIKFEHKKCVGEVKFSLLGKFPCVFKVECERGTVEGDVYDFQSLILTTESGRKKKLKLKSKEKYYTDFGHTMAANFLEVINKGEKPLISGSDVLDSVEWIDECYETASRFEMPWYDIPEIRNGR
jgi:predicted dehydrogenase